MLLCFFGDSFVNGYGDPEFQGWVGRLCRYARAQGHDLTAYNCGIRRASSEDIKTSWFAEAVVRLPREHKGATVFSFGANDLRSDLPLARVLENTRAILSASAAHWPTLFLVSPRAATGDDPERGLAQSHGIGALCDELGIPFFDAFAASANFTHWRAEAAAGDGAHPGAKGYEELAMLIDTWSPWRELLNKSKA